MESCPSCHPRGVALRMCPYSLPGLFLSVCPVTACGLECNGQGTLAPHTTGHAPHAVDASRLLWLFILNTHLGHPSHQRRRYTGRSQNRASNLQTQRRTAAPAGRAVTSQQAPDVPRCLRVPLTDPRTRLRGNCPTLSSSSLLKGYVTATRTGVFDNVYTIQGNPLRVFSPY